MNIQIVDGKRSVSLEEYINFWKHDAHELKFNYVPEKFQYSLEVMKVAIEFDDYLKNKPRISILLELPQIKLEISLDEYFFVNALFEIKCNGKENYIACKFDSRDSKELIRAKIRSFFGMLVC